MTQQLLIIEDEPTLARLLSYNLEQDGYVVKVINDGNEGLREALVTRYDLVILDIMLPGMNGFEILAKLRQENQQTPVMILTARNAEDEIVKGLKQGADEYMTKPFGVAELLARVSNLLRRVNDKPIPKKSETTSEKVIRYGELSIYPDKYEAILNEKLISLRPKEFEVLLYLIERPGIVVTRDQLMNAVWGYDYFGGERTVDVHMSSLRKKMESDLVSPNVKIEAIRGVGYKLTKTK